MNKNEIVAFLNANPGCFLATVDGSAARVRGMMMYRADGAGLVFHSGSAKDVCRQLTANPNVEVCFFDPKSNTQVRVSGRAEFVTNFDVESATIMSGKDLMDKGLTVEIKEKPGAAVIVYRRIQPSR